MTRSALWTKHRGLAYKIASGYRIPGMDRDDVRQEALVALWEATGAYDKTRGRFPAFAGVVIKRSLITLLHAATTEKRTAHVIPLGPWNEPAAPEHVNIAWLRDRLHRLTPLELDALAATLNGDPQTKQHVNAVYRARRKLREAA